MVRAELDQLQQTFLDEADRLFGSSATPSQWDELTARCVNRAHDSARRLLAGFTG